MKLSNPAWTQETVCKARQGYELGIPISSIAAEIGVPRSTVKGVLKSIRKGNLKFEFADGTKMEFADPSEMETAGCGDTFQIEHGELPEGDAEIISSNVRLAKERQKHMDTNRVERKSFREHARIENAVEEYTKSLLELAREVQWTDPVLTANPAVKGKGAVGIVHLSDLHFNEQIQIVGNKYDFKVAAARLKFFISQRAIPWFRSRNVSTVLVAMTGDMLNSDRRLDELLCNACNRARATYLAADILQQVIRELAVSFNVKVAYVVGNESRITEKVAWNTKVATDNYDSTLFYWLQSLFEGHRRVEFLVGDEMEAVVNISDKHILLLHGHINMGSDLEGGIAKACARYAAKGIILDYVLLGHIHSARISDRYARSSSLSGPNAYSEKGLNCTGRASQNMFVLDERGRIDGQTVDLHDVDEKERYSFNEALESYNTKAPEKMHSEAVVVKVVV